MRSDGQNKGYTDLVILTPQQLNDIKQAVETNNAAIIKNYITNFSEGLDIDTTVLSALSAPDKVYDIMSAGSVSEASVSAINKLYYSSVYTAMYNEASGKEAALLKIKDEPFASAAEKSTLLKSALEEKDSSIRSDVIGGVKNEYASFDELENDVERLWLINRIGKAELPAQVESVLKDFAGKLGINTDNVSENVYKSMIKQQYSSFDEVKIAFNTYKANQPVINPSNPGGGSGGSSGGRNNSSNSGIVAPGAVSSDNNTNQSDNKTETVGKNIFPDMENHLWAAEAVTYLYNKGIASGDEKGYFNPEKYVTRKEAVKFIAMLAIPNEIDMSVKSGLNFDDLEWGDWSYPYIAAAVKKGLISGRNEHEFAPNDVVTREELAVMAWNVMKMQGKTEEKSTSKFSDHEDISDWAKQSVANLDYYNIISGITTDSGFVFAPREYANRVETAMIIYNIAKAE